jgi:CheY-like chemotaxis protein
MVVDLMMPLMGGAELRRRQQALPSIDRSPVAVSREV